MASALTDPLQEVHTFCGAYVRELYPHLWTRVAFVSWKQLGSEVVIALCPEPPRRGRRGGDHRPVGLGIEPAEPAVAAHAAAHGTSGPRPGTRPEALQTFTLSQALRQSLPGPAGPGRSGPGHPDRDSGSVSDSEVTHPEEQRLG